MLSLFSSRRIHTSTFLTEKNVYASLILQRGYRPIPSIQTLNPAKLQSKSQEIQDISLRKTVKIITVGGSSSIQFRFRSIKDDDYVTQDLCFPPKTRGVFYYHVDPKLPPISGGIRFRLCDSFMTFKQGKDLHTSIQEPWNISLLRIAQIDRFKGLARFLIEEGLVDMDLIQDLGQLKTPTRFVSLFLYHLSQPLVIDLETTGFSIHLITRKTVSSTVFCNPFYNTNRICNPYSGLARVRFELSKFPEHKKKGPTLVLRILEFLSPVKRVLPPDTGPYIELVPNTFAMRQTLKGDLKPWAYPIDHRSEGAKWREFLAGST